MLFDKRTVLCADFSGAPKLPPITLVRAPTLFVVETQYTCETALNSSTDVLFTAAACQAEDDRLANSALRN